MSLSSNLKKIRKENNLSQEQLADKLGVSRQAVSKWESGLAYPEMEKMVTICKMFNLNIDELLNQDITEVNDTKQTKNNINKYIDDFLGYITKVVDMFSSMSFKSKVKCIFEQIVICCVIAFIFAIIGSIGIMFIQDILQLLPDRIYYVIYRILEDIYLLLALILGIILVLHIFKVRYLDYYVIDRTHDDTDIETEDKELEEVNEKDKNKKIYLEKKQTKVIIRDPENSGYRFISLLFRCCLFWVKVFVAMIAVMFCISMVVLCFLLVLSFMFIKTGLVFIGTLLVILGIIIINLVILDILYNFIVSKKNKKNRLALFFVVSLVLLGVGSGIFCIGITEFEVGVDYDEVINDEIVIPYNDNLNIWYYYDINYIESTNDDLRIVYNHSKYFDLDVQKYDNNIHFNVYSSYTDAMDMVRSYIDDINNKKIVDYSYVSIDIYTSHENIEKLKSISY